MMNRLLLQFPLPLHQHPPVVLKKLLRTSAGGSQCPSPAQSYTPALAGLPLPSGTKAASLLSAGPSGAGLMLRPVTPLIVTLRYAAGGGGAVMHPQLEDAESPQWTRKEPEGPAWMTLCNIEYLLW